MQDPKDAAHARVGLTREIRSRALEERLQTNLVPRLVIATGLDALGDVQASIALESTPSQTQLAENKHRKITAQRNQDFKRLPLAIGLLAPKVRGPVMGVAILDAKRVVGRCFHLFRTLRFLNFFQKSTKTCVAARMAPLLAALNAKKQDGPTKPYFGNPNWSKRNMLSI